MKKIINKFPSQNSVRLCAVILLVFINISLILSAKEPVPVFIVAGQSNTDGRTPNSDLPDYIKAMTTDSTFATGEYNYCKISQNRVDGKFIPFWPKRKKWAYDAVTYYLLEQIYQKDFYVIKWAVGGTSITPENVDSRGGHWSADPKWLSENTPVDRKGKSLLLSFVKQINMCIDRTLSKHPEGYKINAFLWHQGESDQKYGAQYYTNLKDVLSYVRNHLSERTGHDYSKLPFIFGTVAKTNKRYDAEVEAAMIKLASEDSNVYLIDMSKGKLLKDRLHFNNISAEYLGKEMYERIVKIEENIK